MTRPSTVTLHLFVAELATRYRQAHDLVVQPRPRRNCSRPAALVPGR